MSGPEAPFLPYGRHCVEDDDVAAVAEVLRGAWLTTGPKVAELETAFADAVGARHAVACSSGTAALHLAALALDLGPGDVSVVPSLTFVATANAARYVGAEVAFADVDPDCGLMCEEHLEAALAEADTVKAVFPVHLAGQCAPPDVLAARARRRSLAIVEDACHALGARYRDAGGATHRVGSCAHADMACFSLHPVKAIAAGEGGVVTTNDAALDKRLRLLRNHGITREAADFENDALAHDSEGGINPWYYEFVALGLNYRLSDVNCALGLSQVRKLDRFVARRLALAAQYDRLLAPLAPRVRPIARMPDCDPAWHLYVVLIDFAGAGVERAAVMRRLRGSGIGTQVHYIPVHRQPYYRKRYGDLALPGADGYYARCLSLPLFPAMTDDDVARVVDALRDAVSA